VAAIRPHQKTRLHLRDSATVDFGPEGQALTNNGVTVVDDVFTFPSGGEIRLGTNTTFTDSYTVSGWVKPVASGSHILLFSRADASIGTSLRPSDIEVYVQATNMNITVVHNRNGSVQVEQTANNVAVPGEWMHVAVVFDANDSTNLRIYKNATLIDSAASMVTPGSVGDVSTVGRWPDYTGATGGDIADLRVNEYAMTAGEVFDLYNEGRGYDLPERRQLPDTVVHLLDGQTDAGVYGEEISLDEVTYANGAYTFSGTTPHIDFGQTTVLSEADGFSFAGFFKPDAVATRQFLWCHGTVTYVELNGSTALRYKASDNTLRFINRTFAADTVYHVALVVKGSTATLYIDGVEEGTFGVNGSSTFSVSQISAANATFDYQGDMWDCRVFDREISAEEVVNLYRNGLPSIRPAEVIKLDPALYSGSGDLIDRSGNGNNVTLPSGYSVTGDVIDSDGTADGPDLGFDLDSDFTLSAWVRTTDSDCVFLYDTGTRFGFCWQDGSASSTSQNITSGQNYVDGVAIADNRDTLHAAVADGEWHHIALTGTFSTTWGIKLCHYSAATQFRLDGEIDKLAFYSEILTADQIAMLAANREFPDFYHAPFGTLGGEETCIQPERNSGALFNDLSPDATGEGTPSLSDAEIVDGKIEFDGTSDMVSLSDLELGSSDSVTLSMWVTRDTGNCTLFSRASGGGAYYWGLGQTSASASSTGFSSMGQYFDGVNQGSSTLTRQDIIDLLPEGERVHVCFIGDTSTNLGTGFQIGRYQALTSLTLNGRIEDVRVFKRRLTAEEVAFLYNDGTPGVEVPNTRDSKLAVLPSYDTASDGSTSNVIDYSGNTGGSGQPDLSDPPTWTPDTGESGRASLVFVDSETEYIESSEKPIQGNATQFSVFFWMKPTDESTQRSIFTQHGSNGNRSLNLYLSTTGQIVLQTSANGSALTSHITTTLYDQVAEWVPICVTWDADADEAAVWSNGVRDETFSGLAASLHDTASPARIGLNGVGSAGFDGSLDDIAIYQRVLTPAEIARFSERRNIFGEAYTAPTPGSGGLIPIILF
jgi:hypothetical protein